MSHKGSTKDPLGFEYCDRRCIAEHLAKAELLTVLPTLFPKSTDPKIAVPFEEINYTLLYRDVGIMDLPETF
ncbi:hypothetical protein ACKAV7_014681 [Fusarium commune]